MASFFALALRAHTKHVSEPQLRREGVTEKRKRKSRHDLCEVVLLENSHLKNLKLMIKIIENITDEFARGRLWIWVDVKLVEWLDKQVEMGKYRSRSQAVEKIIQSKMREETTRAYEI